MNEHVAAEMLRSKLRQRCEACDTCTAEEADAVPVQALIAFMRGDSTRPWWGGVEPAWSGHLTKTMREVVRAVLEERERCTEALRRRARACEDAGHFVRTAIDEPSLLLK